MEFKFELQGKLEVGIDDDSATIREITFSLDEGHEVTLFGSNNRLREVFAFINDALSSDKEANRTFTPKKS